MRFEGLVAFVTGAGSGIGKSTAVMMAQEGANVVIADINLDGLQETASDIESSGQTALVIQLDVSDAKACKEAVDQTINEFGKLDVLCNIAGIAGMYNFNEMSHELWQRMLNINLSGVFYLSQAAMPELIKSNGNIVNMSSTAGITGSIYNAAYCATKAGVLMMSKSLALEFAKQGVRVNAVCPGGVLTPMTLGFEMPDERDDGLFERNLSATGKMCTPEEIARTVLFLADPESSHITGAAFSVDGGQTAG